MSSIVLGRDADCDLTLDADNVSGHHCRLTFSTSGITVEDLGSTNGTSVSAPGVSITEPALVAPDSIIYLGSHELQLRPIWDRFGPK